MTTNPEQIYALLVEANPIPDADALPETLPGAEPDEFLLTLVGSDDPATPVASDAALDDRPTPRRIRILAVAAALILVVVAAAVVLSRTPNDSEPDFQDVPAPPPPAAVEEATEFLALLDAGDVEQARTLLADPLGSIHFVPVGQVTSTDQLDDYLGFYRAMGIRTDLSACAGVENGPRTEVTCRAEHAVGALEPLAMEWPPFTMTFEVWEDGIRTIGWIEDEQGDFDRAFTGSSFFAFLNEEVRPRGLLQESGDPIWSAENGALMAELVEQYVADRG